MQSIFSVLVNYNTESHVKPFLSFRQKFLFSGAMTWPRPGLVAARNLGKPTHNRGMRGNTGKLVCPNVFNNS
jgi:hypothetical protein